MLKTILISFAATALATPALALSLPSVLDIDFRKDPWTNADGEHSYDHDGTDASAWALGLFGVYGAKLTQGADYGLGVDSFGFDDEEIGFLEWLIIDFDHPTFLQDVWLSKLYDERHDDRGYVALFDSSGDPIGSPIFFRGTEPSHSEGAKQIPINATVASAKFYAKKLGIKGYDYGLVGFSIPDSGSTVALLGGAFLAIFFVRRQSMQS